MTPIDRTRRIATDAKAWRARIIEESDAGTANGTRWARSLTFLLPAVVAVGFLGNAILHGAMAANFNISNTPLNLYLADVSGKGVGGIMSQTSVKNPDGSSGTMGVVHLGIDEATIGTLCAVITQSFAGIDYSIVLSTPAKGATAQNLIADVTNFDGSGLALNGDAFIGRSADEVTGAGGQSLGGAPGGFGIDAPNVELALSEGSGIGYSAQLFGQMTIPGMKIDLVNGKPEAC